MKGHWEGGDYVEQEEEEPINLADIKGSIDGIYSLLESRI